MPLYADQFNQIGAYIPNGGTLSSTLDTEGWTSVGLMIIPAGTAVLAGSMSVQVSVDATHFYPVNSIAGTPIAVVNGTSGAAYSAVELAVIQPYRYVRLVSSVAQPTGVTLKMPVKLL